jgi:hypothetical protein
MDVQGVRRQGTSSNVENDRQTLSGDREQNLLHQDQTLPRGEVRYPPARNRKTLAGAGGAMLRFRLDEGQILTPQIVFPIGYFGLITATHRG